MGTHWGSGLRGRTRLASLGLIAVLVAGLVPLGASPASASTPIMGPMVLNARQMADFFNSQGRDPQLSVSVETLARYFVEEGAAEGIRGDIAFAQAIHETGWFEYGGDVSPEYNNFAGLGATGGVPGNKFSTAREGVRAQIHHLRAYADAAMDQYKDYPDPDPGLLENAPVKPENEPGPRFIEHWGTNLFGSVTTWEGLTGAWAVDTEYHHKIFAIWNDMLAFARDMEKAVPLSGDWNGDGRDTPGWYLDGRVYLTNRTDQASADIVYTYGRPGDTPIVGDWNSNGQDTVSIIRNREWHIKNAHRGGAADHTFIYGRLHKGDLPLAGDWNGNGQDTPGIVRDGEWHLRNHLRGGAADLTYVYGRVRHGDTPITGDWNGDGQDTPGIVRGREWHLRDRHRAGPADTVFNYGRPDDRPVTGNWNRTGGDTPGMIRGTTWHLRNVLRGGAANISAHFPAQ